MERAIKFKNGLGFSGWQPQMSNGMKLYKTFTRGECWLYQPRFKTDTAVLYVFKWMATLTSWYADKLINRCSYSKTRVIRG